MPTLIIFTILSLTFFIYYKVNSWRTKRPYEKQRINAKSSIALGLTLFFFGLNRLFINQTTVIVVICIVFLVIGALHAFNGYRAHRFYHPLAIKEADNEKR